MQTTLKLAVVKKNIQKNEDLDTSKIANEAEMEHEGRPAD
jgi:hypothetical protein